MILMSDAKQKKIAIYIPTLHGGGAERMMVVLANGFTKRGFSVDLVLAKAEGVYLQHVASDVRVVDLNASRVLLSLPNLVRYLRRECPNVMLSALGHANVVAVWSRRLSGMTTKLVLSERNTLSVSHANFATKRERIMPFLMRHAYKQTDGIVAVSTGVADDLSSMIDLPRERIKVVYNPVVTNDLIEQSQEELDHPWFASGQPPVLLAIGRLTNQKGFLSLVHAFSLLMSERFVRLVILGEGELRSELEELVRQKRLSNDVLLPGFVDNPFKWMRNSSLFVLSSLYEGLPGVLIQAMACGTPVVSTDCPSGPSEILDNGRWGRLVPVGDVEALSVAMDETLDEPTHPDVAVRAEFFGVDQAVDGYLEAFGFPQ